MSNDLSKHWSYPDIAREWGQWGWGNQTAYKATDGLTRNPELLQASQLCRIADALEALCEHTGRLEQSVRNLDPEYHRDKKEHESRSKAHKRLDQAVKNYLHSKPSLKHATQRVSWDLWDCGRAAVETNPDLDVDGIVKHLKLPHASLFKEGSKRRAFYEEWLKANAPDT